jgi:tetratricopeptide (TPR) repeat protein
MTPNNGHGRLTGARPHGGATAQITGGKSIGAELMAELPADLGLAALETLRSVLKWAQEDPAMRGDLFEPTAIGEWEVQLLENSASELYACLAVLVGELGKLGDASPEVVAQTCICVTEWALEADFVVTALAFAEAAALSWPANARYAWTAGSLMQSNSRLREATVWLKHAEKAAARQKDRQVQVLALRNLGTTAMAGGRDRDAAKSYRAALRLALRHAVQDQLGDLSHDLFLATANLGEWEAAEEHARTALAEYKNDHPRLPALAHDLARSWITQGFYGRALKVLERLPGYCEDTTDRLRASALLAGAAGAVGNTDLFTSAAADIWRLTAAPAGLPTAAQALVELAGGAVSLQQWEVGERALGRAVALDPSPAFAAQAEAVMDSVRMRSRTAASIRSDDRRHAEPANTLAEDLLATLVDAAR